MSGDPRPDEEDDLLAAELVLGLLDGETLRDARLRRGGDPAFAAAVDAWQRRFAPMAGAGDEVAPPPDLWPRIEQAVGREADAGADIVALRRRAGLWRGYGAAMTALAAGLALVLGLRIAQPEPPPAATAPPATALVAALASDDGTAALAVAYEGERRTLLVAPARLQPAAGHDHELWLIPAAAAAPVSLGLVRTTAPQRIPVPPSLAGSLGAEATIALSVEPTGGSPTGAPTGPVIASGALKRL